MHFQVQLTVAVIIIFVVKYDTLTWILKTTKTIFRYPKYCSNFNLDKSFLNYQLVDKGTNSLDNMVGGGGTYNRKHHYS